MLPSNSVERHWLCPGGRHPRPLHQGVREPNGGFKEGELQPEAEALFPGGAARRQHDRRTCCGLETGEPRP